MRAVLLLLASLVSVASALTYRAADISSLIAVEDSGISYSQDGVAKPFESILFDNGMTAARVRIWTAGQYNLSYGLAVGKRIKDAGLTLHVDLHYSDTCEELLCAWLSPPLMFHSKGQILDTRRFLQAGPLHSLG